MRLLLIYFSKNAKVIYNLDFTRVKRYNIWKLISIILNDDDITGFSWGSIYIFLLLQIERKVATRLFLLQKIAVASWYLQLISTYLLAEKKKIVLKYAIDYVVNGINKIPSTCKIFVQFVSVSLYERREKETEFFKIKNIYMLCWKNEKLITAWIFLLFDIPLIGSHDIICFLSWNKN